METVRATSGRGTDFVDWRRCLFDDAEDAMFVVEADCERILAMNPAARWVTGLEDASLSTVRLQSVLQADDPQDFAAAIEVFRVTGRFSYEGGCSISGEERKTVPVRLRLSRIGEPEPSGVLVVARPLPGIETLPREDRSAAGKSPGESDRRCDSIATDAAGTRRRSIEAACSFDELSRRALEQQGEFIQAVAEATPFLIYIIDVESLAVTYFNRAPGLELGFVEAATKPETLHDLLALMPAEEHQHLDRVIREWNQLATDEVREDEYSLVAADGTVRTFLGRETFFGTVGGSRQILGTACDITERKNALELAARSQAEVEHAHQQLVEAIECLTEGFALYDAEDRLVICNSRYRDIYDVSRDLLVPGVRFEDHVRGSAYRGQIAEAVGREEEWVAERIQQHRNPEGVYRQRLGNGRWLEVSERKTRDGGIVGVRTDVTSRLIAEESLRQSEAMFRSLSESSPALVAIFQGTHHAYANPEFSSLLGYDHDELMTMSFLDYVHPEDREQVLQRSIDRQRGHAVPNRYEIRLLTKSGEERWIDFGGTRIDFQGQPAVLGVALDITPQKCAERERRESEEVSRTLLERHIDGVVVTVGGRIRYVNEPLATICGRQVGNLLGLFFDELVPAVQSWQGACALSDFVEGIVRESEIIHRDGHLVPVEIVSRRIRLKGDDACLAIVRDISWRRKLEDQARQHRELLTRANRVSVLGEMATGLAHELNQPLGAISMLAAACRVKLEKISDDRAEVVSILDQLAGQSIRAGEIVDRIRKFIGKEEFVHTDCRADVLLNGVLAFLGPELSDAECRVDVRIAEALPELHVDRVQIEQVLVNLIHNSVDAYREAGVQDRLIEIDVIQIDDGFCRWAVSDFGPGMSDDVMERVFDAFYSTKSKGMGMGLAICRTIVEAHGGRIDVESRPGNGVTFRFTLPTARRTKNGFHV